MKGQHVYRSAIVVAMLMVAACIGSGGTGSVGASEPNAPDSAWLTTGNSGTNPVSDFVGTTDNAALVMRTNNLERMRITSTGRVGIGTINPQARLQVSAPNTALLASSTDGNGVEGRTDDADFAGVYGNNTIGRGVLGSSNSGAGVVGISTSGNGVEGHVDGSAVQAGVYGSNSGSGAGVRGEGSTGVWGTSTSGYGVVGSSGSFTGIAGTSSSGTGIVGISVSGQGVHGDSSSNTGVYGFSASSYGVWGNGNSSYGVYATSNGSYGVYAYSAAGQAGYFLGDVEVTGNISKGGGSFKIDHPLDPANKYLSHSFVESPDMMNIYNGNVTTDVNGDATITMPDWFQALNRDFRYQLTPIGQFAQAMVSSEIKDDKFTIKTDKPNVKVSWQVTGIRQDPYANAHRIPVEQEKPANEKGKYLHPTEWGQPESEGIDYEMRQRAERK